MSVHALALSPTHEFTKQPVSRLTLLAGLGVQGDCHAGATVQHRSRLHIQPPPPNLRQVHLIPKEILDECGVEPGQLGENVTTVGVDLLALGRGTRLHFLPSGSSSSGSGSGDDGLDLTIQKPHAVVVVQGLRNPCPQIDKFRAGLKERFIVRDEERRIVGRRAGVMGTVEVGGEVSVGMRIVVESRGVFEALGCV
ncbi:pyruvate kinase-like protein [Achaetomium macrosporum]|uniref:Pyruvate kinase-like protein n=1 Tax=Achaetomium macrosporum TaxID=79813 RepID=A0AAN7H583_9PEZI|nr:pyruvate kinase-like protein [Achaetomium macrosporum]